MATRKTGRAPLATDRGIGVVTTDPAGRPQSVPFTEFLATIGSGEVTSAAAIGDNQIVRGDGGVKGIQGSALTMADDGTITFPDDVRQTFNPGANNAGLNVGVAAGVPATPADGDLVYDSTAAAAARLKARIAGAWVSLASAVAADRISNPTLTTPAGLANGDLWVEASGVSPTRVVTIMLRDAGVSIALLTVTY